MLGFGIIIEACGNNKTTSCYDNSRCITVFEVKYFGDVLHYPLCQTQTHSCFYFAIFMTTVNLVYCHVNFSIVFEKVVCNYTPPPPQSLMGSENEILQEPTDMSSKNACPVKHIVFFLVS